MAYSQKFATIAACSEQKGEIKDFLKVIGFIIDFEEKIMVRSVLKQLTAQTRLLVTDNRLIYGRSVFGRFHKQNGETHKFHSLPGEGLLEHKTDQKLIDLS